MENTKPKLKSIVKSKMDMATKLKMLCKKFLWSPHGSASSWIALNNWRGLNKIPWRKYEIVWSKSITSEPASAVGKSPVILPIISPANTCVDKVIWNHLERIKKISSPKMRNREFVFTPKIEYKLVAERSEANLSNLQFPVWCRGGESNSHELAPA